MTATMPLASTDTSPVDPGPPYWATGLSHRIHRSEPTYPDSVRRALGDRAPPYLEVLGNPAALGRDPVALVCSEVCPPWNLLRAYDLACEMAEQGFTVVSGFHSAAERECLRVLLRGTRPVIWCPARGAGPQLLSPAQYRGITDGRLVVATQFGACTRRVTAAAARARNLLVLALARYVVAIHVSPGGEVDRTCRTALAWGKPVRILPGTSAPDLEALGACPLREGQAPGHPPAWARVDPGGRVTEGLGSLGERHPGHAQGW